MMEEVGMSNIGIAVKSGNFLRFVYGNKLARQENLRPNDGDNDMGPQRFTIRLTLSAIVIVVVIQLLCDS